MNWLNTIGVPVLSLLIFPTFLQAQKTDGRDIKETEKVYLHFDRPNYMQGDTIWFKAYSWCGYDQVPDTVSRVLYVDLVNPNGKIALKKRVLIQNGISQGDFCLDKNIAPGRYALRAYTHLMLNSNAGEPFCQMVTINPVKGQYQIPLKDSIDLQFFPEGGTLVIGMESKIAFKAIGTDGLSREVKGSVKDDQGNIVANFASTHKGMGAFLLKPEAGKMYFASMEYNNQQYKFPLPSILREGSTMSVKFSGIKNNPYLSIKYSPSEDSAKKYVVGSAYGKIRFAYAIETTKDSSQLWIPLGLLPGGICRLTVMDAGFKPECERLFYVNKNEKFKIEVTPDSSSYGTRSKVTLFIKTTSSDGAPLQTDLSLAVLDKGQIVKDENAVGIGTYKLLTSELKGYIEDAGFYFKNDSCIRSSELDLLLLTHGYRRFLEDSTNFGKQKFEPERDFVISGKIEMSDKKQKNKNFDYRNINLNFVCWGGGEHFVNMNPDSLGRFRFHSPLFYGKSNAFLNASTLKNKPFKGNIFIDEDVETFPFAMPLSVQNNTPSLPSTYVNQFQEVKKEELSVIGKDHLKTIALKEVVIKARDKFWYRRFEAKAKKIVNLDSIDPTGKKYESLNSLLVREFGAKEIFIPREAIKTVRMPSRGMGPDYYFPIYVINGATYFYGVEPVDVFMSKLSYLSLMRVNEIKKIMVIPPKEDIVLYYANPALHFEIEQSMVVIETYNKGYRGNPEGGKKIILEGLDAPRVFYSPRYEGSSKENPVSDRRTTLYWGPSIMTDANGQAKVDFFTSDSKTSLEVIINGIEIESGHPGQIEALINSTSIPGK